MDSFELSKIAGAVFLALLLIVVPKTIIEMRQKPATALAGGYALPGGEPAAAPPAKEAAAKEPAGKEAAASAPAAAPAAAADAAAGGAGAVVAKIATASAENGKAVFAKCASCHSAKSGATGGLGPNLWGIVGRKAGVAEGFGYSAALKKKGEEGMTWDWAALAAWVEADDKVVPGNKMIFPGVKDPAAAADLLAYLGTLADTPAAPPK